MKENQFLTLTKDGKEVVCDIVALFYSEDTKKDYIVYTDNTKNDNGEVNIMASIYTPREDGGVTNLVAIESEEEQELVEQVLKEMKEGNLDA